MKATLTLRTIKPTDSKHLNELKSKFEKVVEESRYAWEEIDLKSSTLSELLLDLSNRICIIEERLNEPILHRMWRRIKKGIRCLFTNTSVSAVEGTKDTEK